MSTQRRPLRTERPYPDRLINEVGDGYARVVIPKEVLKDDRFGFEPGNTVKVTGIIEKGEAYLKIEPEGEG